LDAKYGREADTSQVDFANACCVWRLVGKDIIA